LTARSLSDLSDRFTAHRSPFPSLLLRGLLLTSRWMTTIMLSAVLLVTAGFAFNETFLFWFPNFAFAFILLGVLMFVQLLGRLAAQRVQIFLSVATLGGLSLLTVMGIWHALVAPSVVVTAQDAEMTSLPYLALLLFVGFDLALNHDFRIAPALRKTMNMGIYVAVLILGLWGLVSIFAVPVEKLSTSFIPHILAARAVGGEWGRLIMGAVIIFGSAGAVNALLFANAIANAGAFGAQSAQQTILLKWLGWPKVWALLAGIVIGILMAVGMAGEEVIDSYVRAGLIVWLLYYGTIHLTLVFEQNFRSASTPRSKFNWIIPALGAGTMISGSTALLFLDHEWMAMLKFTSLMLIIVAILLLGTRRLRSADSNERNKRDNRPFWLIG